MPKSTARKRKLPMKPAAAAADGVASTPKIQKKIEKKKKKPKLSESVSHDSDSDSDPNTQIQTLLEPLSKDQLIALVIDLSSSYDHLFSLVKSAAEQNISHRKIFVHGLGWDATRQSVESVFTPYGEIEDLNVVSDRATGRCKGYAFVTFKSWKSAKSLLKNPRVQIGSRFASCQLASEGPAAAGIVSQKQISALDFPQRKIYVSNVPLNASPEKLRVFFEKFGGIESGPKGLDPMTGKFKGYALFVFKTVDGAKKALEEPNKVFEGSDLYCRKATEGKSKVGGGAPLMTTAYQPVQPQMLAAVAAAQQVQNLGLLGQQAGLVMGGYNGMMGGAFPGLGLGAIGVSGGGDSGSTMIQGLQYAYPNLQPGQTSSSLARPLGTGGSHYSQS